MAVVALCHSECSQGEAGGGEAEGDEAAWFSAAVAAWFSAAVAAWFSAAVAAGTAGISASQPSSRRTRTARRRRMEGSLCFAGPAPAGPPAIRPSSRRRRRGGGPPTRRDAPPEHADQP